MLTISCILDHPFISQKKKKKPCAVQFEPDPCGIVQRRDGHRHVFFNYNLFLS